MTRWYWIRHGPTHERVFTGHRDVPADLSDTVALDRLDAFLPRPALLLSSDLRRARATADALGHGRQRLPDSAALREFDFGAWDGLHHTQVSERDPDLSRRFWEHPGEVAAPDGESWNDVAVRTGAEVDRVGRANPGAAICVVAHIGVILAQIARAAGKSPYEALSHHIAPLSVTELVQDRSGWRVERINHLA